MSPSSPLPVHIAGLGWYLPERRVENAELEGWMRLPDGWIARHTGVCERRRANAHETASFMAARAAEMALAHAGLSVSDLDVIVGASSGPEQLIPCTGALVQRELGAPDGQSACFDIGATCLSFIVALHHVAHLVAAGVYERALIFSSEVVGHSLNPDEPESASLLGDAAAAAIVTRTPPGQISALHHAAFATHSAAGADLTRFLGGGNRRHPNDPQTTPAMNRFEMRGPDVFRLASRVFPPFLDRFFDGLGWKREEFCAAVPHQASGPALRYLSARAGFRPDQVVVNLPCRGNCVAASIPLALAEAVHAGRIRRGERVLLAGTGAGLTLGALALTF